MRTVYKIMAAAGLAVAVPLGALVAGPVVLMALAGSVSSWVISSTPDAAFEDDFAGSIPEVRLYADRYPGHSTLHGGEFLGWKTITYDSDRTNLSLHAKKSVLTGETAVHGACAEGEESAYDIPREEIPRYVENGCP